MTERITDHKNINLAKLHLDVLMGKSNGMIIWQPRIQCWITDKLFAYGELPPPYTGMSKAELYRELGCSARIYEYNNCFVRIDDARVNKYSKKLTENEVEDVVETPVGNISCVRTSTPSSPSTIIKKRWLTSEEDMKVAMWMEERCQWQWNEQHYHDTYAEWGELGAPTVYIPRVNIQQLYIDTMGVEQTIYALIDYKQTVEKYFRIIDESHSRLIDVINDSPIEIINFGDNLHAGTLPPSYFEKYVLLAYQHRCDALHKAGKFVHAHWDGDTKSLLPFARDCGLDGIEAITPQPQGDTTLEEIKEALGDQIFLIDGIAALLFDELYSEEELVSQVNYIIELFAPKLVLGISDEISSTGNIERIRLVGKIVDEYNATLK